CAPAGSAAGAAVRLARSAGRSAAAQASTELSSAARVGASSFSIIRADLRAQAGQLATTLDLQRALVVDDRVTLRRIASRRHARIQERGRVIGVLPAGPRITSSAAIPEQGRVLARVTLALPLDRRLLALVRAATPVPPHAALMLVRDGRVLAGGPVGASAAVRDGEIAFGSSVFT